MPPPKLSKESADRLQLVLDAADTAVDAGEKPNLALAKAARAHALPVGHVRLAVQAFNTGRAVRQLGAEDPWEKAAAYPQATVEGVTEILGAPPERAKAAADLSAYALPPDAPEAVIEKLAARWVRRTGYDLNDPHDREVVGRVTASLRPVAAEPAPAKKAADNTTGVTFKVAAALDAAFGVLLPLPAGAYAAVKAAALREYPDAAAFVFGRLEAEHPKAAAKAAAKLDPTVVTGGHPVLAAVAEVAACKAAAVVVDHDPAPPKGWRKVAGAAGWFEKVAAAPTRHLDLPPDPPAPTPTPAVPPLLTPAPAVKAAVSVLGTARPFWQAAGSVLKSTTLAPATNIHPGGATDRPALSPGQSSALDAGMNATDQQAAVQELLTDQRFRNADPKVIVATYRQLHSLAPRAFQNPAVAADYVHRRLQTGPLSSYDLKTLTDIEKNLVSTQRGPQSDDD